MYPENDYRYYLQHGTKGKTWTWPDHKYLAKTAEGVYLYTKEQVDNARKKGRQFVNNIKNAADNVKGLANAIRKGREEGGLIGGLKNAYSYSKRTRDIKKGNFGSGDYHESNKIQIKKRKALEKNYNKAIGLPVVGKAKRKLNTALASLKGKNLKRNFYKLSGIKLKSPMAIIKDAVKNASEKRAYENKKKKYDALRPKYNENISTQSSKNKAASKEVKNQVRKYNRETGSNISEREYIDNKILYDAYLKKLMSNIKISRGNYQPNGGS